MRTSVLLSALVVAGCASRDPGRKPPSVSPEEGCAVAASPVGAFRLLCDEHVLGSADGKRMEIHWRSFASEEAPRTTIDTYRTLAVRCGLSAGSTGAALSLEQGDMRLHVVDLAAAGPPLRCATEPSPRDRTLVMISEATR